MGFLDIYLQLKSNQTKPNRMIDTLTFDRFVPCFTRDREEFGKGWEQNLNSFCEDIVACPGAIGVVNKFAAVGLPMAIATSSRNAAVAKKRKRYVTHSL